MADNSQFENIKASDCVFSAEIDMSPSSDTAKSAPFEMVARTGEAINHHAWGKVVHDLDGMTHKKRIPIDFNHNPNDIVGYGNRFSTDSGDLVIRGALTPYKENDRATEILFKSQADKDDGGGVPYEASINFAGDMDVERFKEGTVEVNGREFEAPITVIRRWQLRGVAVTPYGYDSGTMTEFNQSGSVTINVIEKEASEMADTSEVNPLDTEGTNKLEGKKEAVDETKEDTQPEDSNLSVEGGDVSEPETEAVVDGKKYMDLFGRVQGALYFADGVSIEEAQALELKRLREENDELKTKLTSDSDDLEGPLPDSTGGEGGSNVLTKMPGEIQVPETLDGNDYQA